MKPYPMYICAFILSILWAPLHGQNGTSKTKVLLDPGHGGTDSGAIGINGILEKEVVLEIALEALRLNKELYHGELELYLTRYSDTLISLGDRSRLARGLRANLFIAIHCNDAPNKRAQGSEVYAATGTEHPYLEETVSLGYYLSKELNQQLGIKDRGIKRANFQVLRETKEQCPALLLEVGFISNVEEAEHVERKTAQTALALALLKSIFKHLENDGDL
ncbi:hypothetical protein MTsPCn9_10580 [Croceitalea sp. MTPC9]|uniref:N-acetylmuramoyl-L-alanine amidase family protein n=1 Tax=unclassified Croceitalea TaxID=2632280 RepID=UPI002B3DC1EA|nr:hypothetical protein MTsPCn6_26660 [Croceitalea sp. MTPC6]GMN16122.1 hypothetical protein MTsPCn9_10580 [Croceitalea sp. MTPC9]